MIAYEGSAALITYFAGVSGVLQQAGLIKPLATPLSGVSGGAFTAVVNHLGLGGPAQRDLWKASYVKCGLTFGADCLAGR